MIKCARLECKSYEESEESIRLKNKMRELGIIDYIENSVQKL